MIKVYTGFRGLAFFLFFVAAVVLIGSVFFWGFTKAIGLLLPFLVFLSYLLIAVFVIVFLPATLIKTLRPLLAVYAFWMSTALNVLTWMVCFFFVVKAFGFLGILLSFLFQLLAPVALIGAVFKGLWPVAANLVVWISFAYGMKFYSRRLLEQVSSRRPRGNVIDVDAIEIE
jgi:hypothetical protein